MVFLSPSRQILTLYLKLGHDHFLYILYDSSSTYYPFIRRCILYLGSNGKHANHNTTEFVTALSSNHCNLRQRGILCQTLWDFCGHCWPWEYKCCNVKRSPALPVQHWRESSDYLLQCCVRVISSELWQCTLVPEHVMSPSDPIDWSWMIDILPRWPFYYLGLFVNVLRYTMSAVATTNFPTTVYIYIYTYIYTHTHTYKVTELS
jgi:hypothetical protein